MNAVDAAGVVNSPDVSSWFVTSVPSTAPRSAILRSTSPKTSRCGAIRTPTVEHASSS